MVTPSRIRLARERRALTLARLARMSGISQQALSGYENGLAEPTHESVRAIAHALGFPVAFLAADEIEEIPSEAVAFRARTKTSLRKQRAVRAQAALGVELNDWLTDHFTLPPPRVPTYGKPFPEAAAEMVRSLWELGDAAAPNLVHLLEAHGVRVFSLDTEHQDVDAFSFWRDSVPYVFLNTAKSGERGRFDAAHELGHLVMHGHERPSSGPEAEREANQFASAFLLPRADVVGRMPSGAQVDQLLEAKGIWRVSAMALTYRLHDLDLLTDWQYRAACRRLAELGYRSGEPDGIARETSQILPKVFALLRRGGRTPASVAAELSVPLTELNALVFGLSFVARPGAGGRQDPARSARPVLRVVPDHGTDAGS
ncbi:Zn-dependent peptidase ImmA (M78 family)/DNA-binding XRE family transcriptional regulator [Nocardiopsis aegyptia]|uniref:Zn-dependent peptidase ImmA (M78 family)/DNA-binding XRE family transcriptional regulator n=2 Tax=Nocardiopsis aegyptia TaxID=220378 RepID=A0A7Z0ET53_9ACTN|nr:Zn-dependent peptidase ImmA (M78 family)/DNA-binding XRE family transcriptional regulator [Nocardiopsis aegyptia]